MGGELARPRGKNGFNSERGDAQRCEKGGEMRRRMRASERGCLVAGVRELEEWRVVGVK